MRIQRVQIFGFGKWIDKTFTFQDETFICFYGKNEAGKSTLQQFFFYMFFGLPPRKLARYKPKYSNKIGGTLTLDLPEVGEVTIERVESEFRLFLPNGEIERDESLLEIYLNNLQEETYRAVYGFSSLDLFQLHKMKQQDLSDLLFSVSLTGSTAVYDLERKLNRQLDHLFKRAGRRPVINEQLSKVKRLEKELIQSKKEVLSYSEKVNEFNRLKEKLAKTRLQMEKIKQSYTFFEKVLHFLPQIRTYKRMTKIRDDRTMGQVSFPENGLERYEQLKKQLLPIEAESKNIIQTIREYEGKILQMKNKLLPAEYDKEIVQLLDKQTEIERDEQSLLQISLDLKDLETNITTALSRLHMTEDDLANFQPAFHASASWKQLIEEGQQLQYESERIEESRKLIEQKRQHLLQERSSLQGDFIGYDALDHLRQAVRSEEENQRHYERLHTLQTWNKDRLKQTNTYLLGTSFLAGLFFLLFLFQSNQSFLFFSLGLVAVIAIQIYYQKQTKEKIISHSKKLENLEQRRKKPASVSIENQEDLASSIANLDEALKNIAIEQLQWEEKHHHFLLKEQKWSRAVELEQEKHPLLHQVELEFWPELLHHSEKINELREERDSLVSKQSKIETKLVEVKKRIERIGTNLGLTSEPISLHDLEQKKREHDKLLQQIEQYEQLKAEATDRLTLLKEEQKVLQEEVETLFHPVNAMNEEEFYQRAREIDEMEQVENTYLQLKEQLGSIFSSDEISYLFKEEIDEYEWEQKLASYADDLTENEEQISLLKEGLTTIQVEIDQLESSDDYSKVMHIYELERDRLNTLAEKWAVKKTAQAILEKAKWSYQQKYIEDVLNYTSAFFNFLTLNRYTKVYPPTESTSFQVEASNKMRYTVEELSKGTIDQLYVALRFAISKVMSEKFVVPLMIDDAFIHFDEERATLAVKLLEEISKDQQVLLFTCEKHVAESISKPKSLRIDL